MKTSLVGQSRSGFSLVELVIVILVIGLIASIVMPNLVFVSGEADKVKDKRNAQNIILAYTTGLAAGVEWPEGNVAAQVSAVLEGRKPPSGSLASMMFQSSVTAGQAARTYQYIGIRGNGELFFDSSGGQNPAGN
ncbi:type II secretion system protein [Prosthecobacter fluviatilis]|uniref:Type II secretion system protein n=1 Tax=Prosthecobacter fluviatilis TaxID=445931 RepID=A0ABW0KL21_9BACT